MQYIRRFRNKLIWIAYACVIHILEYQMKQIYITGNRKTLNFNAIPTHRLVVPCIWKDIERTRATAHTAFSGQANPRKSQQLANMFTQSVDTRAQQLYFHSNSNTLRDLISQLQDGISAKVHWRGQQHPIEETLLLLLPTNMATTTTTNTHKYILYNQKISKVYVSHMVNGLMPGIPFCFERWQNLDFQAQSFNADRLEAPSTKCWKYLEVPTE